MQAAASILQYLHQIRLKAPREARETPFYFAKGVTLFRDLSRLARQLQFPILVQYGKSYGKGLFNSPDQ